MVLLPEGYQPHLHTRAGSRSVSHCPLMTRAALFEFCGGLDSRGRVDPFDPAQATVFKKITPIVATLLHLMFQPPFSLTAPLC